MSRSANPPPQSLRAVQAFAVVARLGSVTAAAGAMAVTPSALSHLIRQLEVRLGAPLFSRAGRGLQLTAEGARLAAAVGPALAAIEEALAGFARRRTELRISTVSTFAVRWLIPRLSRFQALQPDIEIFLSTSPRVVSLTEETFDCAIRLGKGPWPGVAQQELYREQLLPVCSPRWLAAHPMRDLRDLRRAKLLHARARRQDWAKWLADAGVQNVNTEGGPVFETRDLALQAALAQMGVAVVDPRFVEAEVAAGQLVVPFARPLNLDTGYWLVWHPDKEGSRPLAAFRGWLEDELSR